jgi:4-hydroxy-2-oxoheptanedioate aldolase
MKLAINSFTHALRSGKKQVGIWISLCSPFAAQVVEPSGYDWALLDMEHAPNDLVTVMGQLEAFKGSSTTAIVRPPWNDSVAVKRLLDTGAMALLFPMIQSVEEAKSAVAATRYPPRGIRGVSGSTRANKFGRVTDYFKRFEDELAVLLQLETLSAIEKAEEIADVDGVTGIFFGPADIAADMGLLGQPTAPEVWEVIRECAGKLMAKGVPVGTLVFDPKFANELLESGFTFVAVGSDISLLTKGADALRREIDPTLKD